MDNVPTQFHSLVTDGSTEQILLLVECLKSGAPLFNYYLSSDGDMTVDGATFTDELTSEDNYGLGCIPSRTMSVSLMNLDGHLNGHSYGWVHAYIGALNYSGETNFPSGVNVALDYQGESQDWDGYYECRTDGFFRDSQRIEAGNCTGAFTSGDGLIYFFIEENGKPVCYVYDCTNDIARLATDTPSGKYITEDFVNKFSTPRFIDIDPIQRYFVEVRHDMDYSYRICSMGHFRVDKPKKTLTQTINITDAFDLVHELDVDASTVLATTNAANGYALLNALLTACGLRMDLATESIGKRLQDLSIDLGEVAKDSYTCRKLVSYLLEAIGCNARLKTGTDYLHVYLPNEETAPTAYPIGETRIAANSLEIQEYICHEVDRVSVKNLDGETKMYPSVGDYCYEYDGNPFVHDATRTQFSYVRQIPQYQPMSFHLIEADPSFQAGDLIRVELTYGEDEVLTDYFGREITTYNGEEILIVPSEGKWVVPIMAQTIVWNGKTSADIEVKGSEERSGYSSGNYTDFNSRVNSGGEAGGNISQFTNDVGYLTLQTLPIYGGDVQIVYDGEVT